MAVVMAIVTVMPIVAKETVVRAMAEVVPHVLSSLIVIELVAMPDKVILLVATRTAANGTGSKTNS